MARNNLPKLSLAGDEMPADESLADSRLFDGVLARRIVAHIIDSVIVSVATGVAVMVLVVMNVITLGLLAVPAIGLGIVVPVLYFTVFTGGPRAATPGMRLFRIELRTIHGGAPSYAEAAFRTVLYYATILVLSPLVLVVALLNARRRALHDILSGTVVVNHMEVAG